MSRVLLIGWESADWRLLRPLMDQGRMPHLSRMVSDGVSGDLGITLPRLTSSLWTSVATGKRAHKHRVLRSIADLQQGRRAGTMRRSSALWSILDRSGLSSVVVGWPATDPAEPIRGALVSDQFLRLKSRDPVVVPGPGFHPPRLGERLSELVVSPDRLNHDQLGAFLDEALDPAGCSASMLDRLRARAAELSTVQAMTTGLAQWEPWDLLAVHFPAMRLSSPEGGEAESHPGLCDGGDCRLLTRSFVCLDQMLGTLVQVVGPETRILLVSGGAARLDPHCSIPSLAGFAAMASAPRERGVLVMTGPDIRAGTPIFGASILDVTPTLLQAFGLPVGEDMDGAVLPVFKSPTRVAYVPGWDPPDGMHSQWDPMGRDPGPASLGTVEAPEMMQPDERYHLACDLVDCGRLLEAIGELERSWSERPSDLRCGLLLMRCRLHLRRLPEAREVFEALLVRLRDPDPGAGSGVRLDQNALWYLEAELLEREGRLDAAMRIYRQMLQASPIQARRDLHLRLAEASLRLGERSSAIQNLLAACSIDPTHVPSFIGLSRAYLLTRRFQDAVAESRRSIELDPSNPSAHFLHGVALTRCGHPDWAAESLEEAVRRSLSYPQAHRRLARIYQRHLEEPVKARHHLQLFHKARGLAAKPSGQHIGRGVAVAPAGRRSGQTQGRMAKARAGKPRPPAGLGQATTISAPVGGT